MVDLDELERLEKAVQAGPWHTAPCRNPRHDHNWVCYCIRAVNGESLHLRSEDMDFIAATRNALPELLAEVRLGRSANAAIERITRTSRRVREDLEQKVGAWRREAVRVHGPDCADALVDASAEIERLVRIVTELRELVPEEIRLRDVTTGHGPASGRPQEHD